MTPKNEMSKCCWENGANRLAQYRVATNLQFVKTKQNETTNTTRLICEAQ